MINDLTPEQVAGGRRDALTALAAIVSDDDEAVDFASAVLGGQHGDEIFAGLASLLIESLAEHGEDLAAWIARRQDEAAALADD